MTDVFRLPGMKAMALAAVVLVLAALGGCGRGTGSGAPQEQLPDGRTFLSSPPSLDFEFRLSFDDGELRADAGCNTLLGQARLDDGRLVVGELGSTEMGCSPALMRRDDQLAEFLSSNPSWRLDGDELTLASGDQKVRLLDRKVADPDRPLHGTKWVLDTLIDSDTASSLPSGVRAYLELSRTRAGGNAGCNEFGGKLTVRGSELQVSDIVMTRRGCLGEAEKVERATLDVLESEHLEYRIEADRLTLETPSGKGLAFHAHQAEPAPMQ